MINSQLVLDALEARLDYAQMLDYDFHSEDYEWILGIDIICALRDELEPYLRYTADTDDMYIFGIPVTPDLKDKLRVSLVKEIKRL